ncbi:hypothetical protein SDC9_212110 [bioreactor metagenome]|uniref:Uncharacterized protein n=1 Tax=bioreactor metagenome TaxID=1076179 RepID=A0A645JKY2_9ZZZZ
MCGHFDDVVQCYCENSVFTIELFLAVILRECHLDIKRFTWSMPDQLFKEIVNVACNSNGYLCSGTVCAASLKLHTVNAPDIINIDSITICNSTVFYLFFMRVICHNSINFSLDSFI